MTTDAQIDAMPDANRAESWTASLGQRILIADDDPLIRKQLAGLTKRMGLEPEVYDAGDVARHALLLPDAPRLALLDWHMPGQLGVDLIASVRSANGPQYQYMILVTTRCDRESCREGLAAGADDFLMKPVDILELEHRIRNGLRVLSLEDRLVF